MTGSMAGRSIWGEICREPATTQQHFSKSVENAHCWLRSNLLIVFLIQLGPHDEIGRRNELKIRGLRACRFESGCGHQRLKNQRFYLLWTRLLGMKSSEIKPEFSLKYVVVTITVALIPTIAGILFGFLLNEFTRDKKIIDLHSFVSANIAAAPDDINQKMSIQLLVTPTQKEQVKAIYQYKLSLTNSTNEGLEDFYFTLTPDDGIILAETAEISTTPSNLIKSIMVSAVSIQSSKQTYKVSLLNPRQSIHINVLGYSREILNREARPLSLFIGKKDWSVRTTSDASASISSALARTLNKRISETTGVEVVVLLIVSLAISTAFFWYFRIALAIPLYFFESRMRRIINKIESRGSTK